MPEPPARPAGPARPPIIRRLLGLAWAYRARSIVVLVFQVALLLLSIAGLGLTGLAIDVMRAALDAHAPPPHWPLHWTPPAGWPPMKLVMVAGGMVLALALVRAGLSYVYNVSVGRLVQWEVVPALRTAVYAKLQRMSFRFFDATASGSIINRVTGDVQNVRSFVDQVLLASIVLVLALAVYLAYMLRTHVGLTLACLAPTPLLWALTMWFSRWARPRYDESRRLSDRLITTLSETIQGMSVIKGFAREDERRAQYQARNAAVYQQQLAIFARVSVFSPSIDLLSNAGMVVLLGYGGWLVIGGRLTLGEIIVFAGLLQQYGGQVANLANIVNSLQQSLISADRVFEVLDAPADVETPATAVTPEPFVGHLRFENVRFGYREGETTLDGIDLEIRPGERVVLFGETGSGKSTLLSLVPRFYDPTGGRVLVSGVDVREQDLLALRARIGVVFQESVLFSTSVADNIAFGRPQATDAEIERAARLACAHEFIVNLPAGYDTVLEEGGSNLSGGQRQRLALARALLVNPAILLLDDPTAAVDTETEAEVMAALEAASAGRTTILSTHRIALCRTADRVLVMEDGHIIEAGAHAALVAAGGRYAAVARLQQEGETPHPEGDGSIPTEASP